MGWLNPRTWAAGEITDASMFNTHVRDNLNWLDKDAGWIAPTFQNSWTNYADTNFSPVGYRRVGPFTVIRGLAAGGTVNATIFTLPDGYRPHRDHRFSLASAQNAPRQLYISALGLVQANSVGAPLSNAWVSLSCVFQTELV